MKLRLREARKPKVHTADKQETQGVSTTQYPTYYIIMCSGRLIRQADQGGGQDHRLGMKQT